MYQFGMALLFIIFEAALLLGGGFIVYMISSLKRDEYMLIKPWYYYRAAAKYTEWECPYCYEHIKVYDDNTLPDNCPECGHKVRKESKYD